MYGQFCFITHDTYIETNRKNKYRDYSTSSFTPPYDVSPRDK